MEAFDKVFLNKVQTISSDSLDINDLLCDPLFQIMNKPKEDSKDYTEMVSHLPHLQLEEHLYGMWYWLRRSKKYWYIRIKDKIQKDQPNQQVASSAVLDKLHFLILKQELVYLMTLLEILPNLNDQLCIGTLCNFINQLFVENPQLIKEIHRPEHLYDVKIIPKLVKGVPSMHVALDFALKLFHSRPVWDEEAGVFIDLEIFGASLIAELSVMYPNNKTFEVCEKIIDKLAGSEGNVAVLEKIITAFPNLIPKISDEIKKWPDNTNKSLIDRIQIISDALQDSNSLIYYPKRFL
jgi:hypothetical protein